ncbi:MAG: isoprenylcysteine carboxyl methyltransferase family protein [Aestuariivirgaceae bacterium]
MSLQIIILAIVVAQRLSELVIARRNTAALLANGGYEVGAGHYPAIVALHASWLLSLFWLAPSRPVIGVFLVIYCVLQGLRVWVLTTMGKRWTTRIIIVPGEEPVTGGPFRFLRHPNYAVVSAEIACLPLVFGLWQHAVLFSVLNAIMLRVRISAESEAWAQARSPK